MRNLESWAQLVLLLGKYRRPGRRDNEVARDAAEIRRMAAILATLAVAECNTGLSERQQTREERTSAKLAALVAEGYEGLTCRFGGDPRGYVFALVCRDGEYNSWGGAESGWGVA